MSFIFEHLYQFNAAYQKPVAYICMEFAIHQTPENLAKEYYEQLYLSVK